MKIAYSKASPDPTKEYTAGKTYMMDHEGRNRRQLSSHNENLLFLNWSPDDKWIVYQHGQEARDASVYVIPSDATGRSTPKFISKGARPHWLDSQSVKFYNREKRTNFRISLQGGEPIAIYRDSTTAVPIMGGDYFFFRDYRKGREGFYVISSVDAQAQNSDAASKIGELNVTRWALSPSRRFLLEYHAAGEVWKVSLPDGKRERLGGAFTNPNIEPGSISFSFDDKEAVYATKRISGKLVLIENFIK